MNDEQELVVTYAASDVRATDDFYRGIRKALMGADGFRPDHYHSYDTSRLGGTMADSETPEVKLLNRYTEAEVFIFDTKVVIVTANGIVREIGRA